MKSRRRFIKQVGLGALGISLVPGFSNGKGTPTPSAFTTLPRSTPEQHGIASSAIRKFLNAVENSEQEFHGFMLVRHGYVVAEGWWSPFAAELKHSLYSLSKSFTSTAVGMVIADGKLSVDDPVFSFFPEDAPADVSENLRAMQIKHLLTMNTGHAEKPFDVMQKVEDKNWAKAFLSQEVVYQPGTHFLYNTGATYMLSAIVQKLTGQTVFDLLSEQLFKPLNIEGADWETDPNGITVGGYGLRVRTEDIARLGQLYLQKGNWNGQQLLPAQWVEDATKKQTDSQVGDNDWSQGYGYQFWRCKPEPGFYRGDGAFGQYCIVIPQKDTVIAINSESPDMQASMNLVWDHLLPALQDEQILTADEAEQQLLAKELKNLLLPAFSILADSTISGKVSGKEFLLEKNEQSAKSVAFSFEKDVCKISISDEANTQTITCGMGKWLVGNNEMNIVDSIFVIPKHKGIKSKVAASATWQDDQTLLVNLKFIENIHGDQWKCRFDGDKVTISFKNSLATMENREDIRKDWIGS